MAVQFEADAGQVAELRALRLEPGSATTAWLERLHGHLRAGLDDALGLLRGDNEVDVDDLRGREIEINAAEAELREHLHRESAGGALSPATLQLAELANSYEGAGNQVYRLSLGLLPDEF